MVARYNDATIATVNKSIPAEPHQGVPTMIPWIFIDLYDGMPGRLEPFYRIPKTLFDTGQK